MIVEQRDYHVYTGKLPDVLRLYEEEGIRSSRRSSAASSARSRRRSARSRRTRRLALRVVRRARGERARLQADPRWKAFLEGAAALPHTAEPHPRPDLVLAASVSAYGKVAIVTGGAQGIGAAIAAGSPRGRRS